MLQSRSRSSILNTFYFVFFSQTAMSSLPSSLLVLSCSSLLVDKLEVFLAQYE